MIHSKTPKYIIVHPKKGLPFKRKYYINLNKEKKSVPSYIKITRSRREQLDHMALKHLSEFAKQIFSYYKSEDDFRKNFKSDFMNGKFDEYAKSVFKLPDNKLKEILKVNIHPKYPLAMFHYNDTIFYKTYQEDKNGDDIWTPELRNMRGIVFEFPSGKIVAVPQSKFFNYGGIETSETTLDNLPLNEKIKVVEKIDGVMINAFNYKNNTIFTTKGNFQSSQSKDLNDYLQHHKDINKKISNYLKKHPNLTLGFEYVDPKSRIVVDYGNDEKIYLHTVREKNGKTFTFGEVKKIAEQLNLDTPPTLDVNDFNDLLKIKEQDKSNREGFVVYFENGQIVKVKTDHYFNMLKGLRNVSYRKITDVLKKDQYEEWVKKLPEELLDLADKYKNEIIEENKKIFDTIKSVGEKFKTKEELDEHIAAINNKIEENEKRIKELKNSENVERGKVIKEANGNILKIEVGSFDNNEIKQMINELQKETKIIVLYKGALNNIFKKQYKYANKKSLEIVYLLKKDDEKFMGSKFNKSILIRKLMVKSS